MSISKIIDEIWGYSLTNKDYVLLISVLLNIILCVFIYRKYYLSRFPLVRVSIKKHRRDFPEYKIRIRNRGSIPLEMEAPVVIFRKQSTKRVFQVRNGITSFPLGLFPKEEYDFIIDLARFYNADSSLITYSKLQLEIRDKSQRKIKRKRIKIK